MMRIRLTLTAFTLSLLASVAHGQDAAPVRSDPVLLRVRVTDTAGTAMPDADVSLVHGLQDVVARGATDASGARTITGTFARGDYALVVRKIGFARVEQFVTLRGRDTLALDVRLRPVTTTLAQVTITDAKDAKRAAYFIDADQIAHAHTTVLDALDIVARLRPDMIHGRSGNCGAVSNVWVNGDRIRNIVEDPALVQRREMMEDAARLGRTHVMRTGSAAVPLGVSTVLAGIHPEHIEELRYHDCDDLSLKKVGGSPAIFVVLKPGIRFTPTQGSYVFDDKALRKQYAGKRAAKAAPPAPPTTDVALTFAGDTLARYRFRLLGVFDAASGEPVADVHVTDVATGADAATTRTGTVSLYFLRPGENKVRLTHAGHRPLELAVTIAPGDTVPITALLEKP